MNEWLNENVDPVLPPGGGNVVGGVTELPSGVPTCYMRSPTTPVRRPSANQGVIQGTVLSLDMPGGSAKKRWLRQAISEETESPQFNGLCPSPNSRPGKIDSEKRFHENLSVSVCPEGFKNLHDQSEGILV